MMASYYAICHISTGRIYATQGFLVAHNPSIERDFNQPIMFGQHSAVRARKHHECSDCA